MNVFCAGDFRRVYEFGNSRDEYRFHCVFGSLVTPPQQEEAPAPTIPLIARTSCHGVLTRKHVYSGNNVDAGPRETTDMILDNVRMAVFYRV